MKAILVGRNGKNTIERVQTKMLSDPSIFKMFVKHNGETFWKCGSFRRKLRQPPSFVGAMSYTGHDVVIRWAITEDVNCSNAIIYNTPEAIKLSSNKKATRAILKEKNIPTPVTYNSIDDIIDKESTIIARPSRHRAGEHFFVCKSEQDLINAVHGGCTYFSNFYPKTIEYRVHCGHGKVLALQKKVGDTTQYIWNHALNGFSFEVVKWEDYRARICKPALDACAAVGLDFGAVDIMAAPEGQPKDAVVCEINTSPSLCEYTSSRYAKYFDWLFGSDERRPHYDYSQWTVGKSFAWKNDQLDDKINNQPTEAR